jgi:transposase
MTPHYGRAPRGERVVGTVPRNHGPNTTLVAAPSLDGITAAMTVEGALDRSAFDAFVAQVLAPGHVVWDKLNVHKSTECSAHDRGSGLPAPVATPYSPDFTPIEQAFSKLKTALRRTEARTRAELDASITARLATISAADSPGWFAPCGYPIPAHPQGGGRDPRSATPELARSGRSLRGGPKETHADQPLQPAPDPAAERPRRARSCRRGRLRLGRPRPCLRR